jgi:hypothetical protein
VERGHVDREDLVVGLVAQVRLFEAGLDEAHLAGVGAVSLPRRLDHLRGAVDRRDTPGAEPLADERHRHSVPTADLEDAVVRRHVQSLDGPDKPVRCRARHNDLRVAWYFQGKTRAIP